MGNSVYTGNPNEAGANHTSKFNTMLNIVTNKKALDDLVQRHQWEMEKQAQADKEAMARQKQSGEYGLEQQRIAGGFKSQPYEKAAQLTTQSFTATPWNEQSEGKYEQAWQSRYKTILGQILQGDNLADGGSPASLGENLAPEKPGMFTSWGAPDSRAANPTNIIDKAAGFISGARKDGNNKPVAKSTSVYKEGQTATNPQTGQKIVYRGGKWQVK